MFFADLLLAFIIALIITSVFTVGFKRRGAWPGFMIFLLLIFLVTWAGGVWITPVGPMLWGTSWLPFLFVGIIVAMLLTAFEGTTSESPVRLVSKEERKQEEQSRAEAAALGAFFWILITVLGMVILLAYLVD